MSNWCAASDARLQEKRLMGGRSCRSREGARSTEADVDAEAEADADARNARSQTQVQSPGQTSPFWRDIRVFFWGSGGVRSFYSGCRVGRLAGIRDALVPWQGTAPHLDLGLVWMGMICLVRGPVRALVLGSWVLGPCLGPWPWQPMSGAGTRHDRALGRFQGLVCVSVYRTWYGRQGIRS